MYLHGWLESSSLGMITVHELLGEPLEILFNKEEVMMRKSTRVCVCVERVLCRR